MERQPARWALRQARCDAGHPHCRAPMLSSLSAAPGSAAAPAPAAAPPCGGAGVRAASAPRCSQCAPVGSAPPAYFRCSSLQGAHCKRVPRAPPRGAGVQVSSSEQIASVFARAHQVRLYGNRLFLIACMQAAATHGSWTSARRSLARAAARGARTAATGSAKRPTRSCGGRSRATPRRAARAARRPRGRTCPAAPPARLVRGAHARQAAAPAHPAAPARPPLPGHETQNRRVRLYARQLVVAGAVQDPHASSLAREQRR